MSQQAEWMAVRAAASSAVFHFRAYLANAYDYSSQSAVQNFETAVSAWESARTPAAASAAMIALEVAPMAMPAGRPSPAFREGAEKIVAGLTKIVNETR